LDSKASTAARYREPVTRAHINHVSIGAQDLQDSVQFYTEIFGAEPIDTPNRSAELYLGERKSSRRPA